MIKVVSIRAEVRGDDLKLTTMAQTGRGTTVRYKQGDFKFAKHDKKELRIQIESQIKKLLAE